MVYFSIKLTWLTPEEILDVVKIFGPELQRVSKVDSVQCFLHLFHGEAVLQFQVETSGGSWPFVVFPV